MTIKDWVDILMSILPYIITLLIAFVVMWANSNYVSRKYLKEVLVQELTPIKEELDALKHEVDKGKSLYNDFSVFKAEYKGDAKLQNEQMRAMSETLKAIADQLRELNKK